MVKASKVKQRRKAFEQVEKNEAELDRNNEQNTSHNANGEILNIDMDSHKYSKQNYKSKRRLMRLQKAMRLTSAHSEIHSIKEFFANGDDKTIRQTDQIHALSCEVQEEEQGHQQEQKVMPEIMESNEGNSLLKNNNKKKKKQQKLNKMETVGVKQTNQIKQGMKQKMRRNRVKVYNSVNTENETNEHHLSLLNEKGWNHVHAMTRMKAAQRELNLFNEVLEEPSFTQDPFSAMLSHLHNSMPTLQPLTEDIGRLPRTN